MSPKAKQRPGGSGVRAEIPKPRRSSSSAPKSQPAPVAVVVEEAPAPPTSPEDADLVLTSRPVARHRFRLRLNLLKESAAVAGVSKNLNYVLLVPRLLTQGQGHPRFSAHELRIDGTSLRGKPIETFEFQHFVLANVPFSAIQSLVVEHTFTSHAVALKPRGDGDAFLPVPELKSEERLVLLGDDVDRAPKLCELLRSRGLERASGERDVAYATRLGLAMQAAFTFDVAATEDSLHLLPTLVFERERGDSRAFNAGFVYALRAQGIPAQLVLGVRYGADVHAACGCFAASWAQSEFFAEDIGWVPCDVTPGSQADLECRPDFVAWHSARHSRAEAREFAGVMRAASLDLDGVLARITKLRERKGYKPGEILPASELVTVVAGALGITAEAAGRRVVEVLAFCKAAGAEGSAFAEGYAGLELGRCPVHLGAGKGLYAAGLVGAALFEGGPYEDGVPLDLEEMVEMRLLLRGNEGEAGGLSSVARWSLPLEEHQSLFGVNYEFTELPLSE